MMGDCFGPGVVVEAGFLLGFEEEAFEVGVWPILVAEAPGVDGFGEQLVAIGLEGGEVDVLADDGPEAAPSGFVLQPSVLVGGADEEALAWLVDVMSAVGW